MYYYSIGFEYEGVIKNNKNQTVLFCHLSPSAKRNILANYHKNKACNKQPYDRYQCLAEIKTEPFKFGESEGLTYVSKTLLHNLFNEISVVNHLFHQNGYHISWQEEKIDPKIHEVILSYFNKSVNPVIKPNKTIYQLSDNNEETVWTSQDNFRRGGGLHINISNVDMSYTRLLKTLHSRINCHKDPNMHSVYRNSLIYRKKIIDEVKVLEYMPFGFQIPNRFNFDSMFNFVKCQFHWCDTLVQSVLENVNPTVKSWD